MTLLDQIAAHAANKPTIEVKVPEWQTSVFFRPVTAMARRRCHLGVAKGDDTGLMINTLIELALDEKGKRLFEGTPEERATLEGKADFAVIARILGEAGADAPADDVADVKNA